MADSSNIFYLTYPHRKKFKFVREPKQFRGVKLVYFMLLFFILLGLVNNVVAIETAVTDTNKTSLDNRIINTPEEEKTSLNRAGRLGFSDFIVTFSSLLLILILIIFVAWLVKRSGFTLAGDNQIIQLLASIPVGQKERVALIQVGEEQILIGVSTGNVQKLHVLKQPIELKENSSGKINNNLFELALKKYQQKTKK